MASDTLFHDGVIVINKPAGPTSHDVVAVMRRTLLRAPRFGGQVVSSSIVDRPSSIVGRDERRSRRSTIDDGRSTIDDRRSTTLRHAQGHPEQRRGAMKVGHTGTLDPLASGVLPLVLGKATRLAQFLSSAAKEYEADIELGVATTTFDRGGEIVDSEQTRAVSELTASLVEETVASFRGTYLQRPPAYSAKKIDGDRAYDLARRKAPVRLEPVEVTATALDVLEWRGSVLRVRLVCSAGYYVRSLANDIGVQLGTGAHLAGLVRTRSGDFSIAQSVGLDVLDRRPEEAAAQVIPLEDLLPSLPTITLTAEGASLAARGGFLGPAHVSGVAGLSILTTGSHVRLLHPDGHLVAIAESRAGTAVGRSRDVLHPGIVLE